MQIEVGVKRARIILADTEVKASLPCYVEDKTHSGYTYRNRPAESYSLMITAVIERFHGSSGA